ncbi:interleukin-1 beta-like [Pseudophryne corroboree]|uniref:interleukin-1 beta-like n=1 Tax=Pseudophryne corroboree TaxID=495146 RepID=UPI0030816707
MAEVHELNLKSIDSYSENEEFYAERSCEMKTSKKHFNWTPHCTSWSTCRSEIETEIRKPEKTLQSFKKAIMLVVVVEKLKRGKGCDKLSFFDDSDLLDQILVEEEISLNNIEETYAPRPKLRRRNTIVHIIRDCRQKCLALQEFPGSAHLVALFLQGKNLEQQVKINVGTYISAPLVEKRLPVTLGIAGGNLFLSCVPEEGTASTPVLSLTEVTNIRGKKNDDLLPFLFYKTQNTSHNTTFESVAFPGWYISTSQQEHQFVQMKPQNDQVFLRDFDVTPEGI